LLFSACGGVPLEGSWDGVVDCGLGITFAMAVDVGPEDGLVAEGTGSIGGIDTTEGVAALTFDLQVTKDAPGGPQDLDVDISGCEYDVSGVRFPAFCDSPSAVNWDGADRIDGDLEDFQGSGFTCGFELDR